MAHLVTLIPLLPLAGFAILAAFGRKLGNPLAGWLATTMVGASFVVTILVFISIAGKSPGQRSFDQTWFTWLPVGHLQVTMGLLADPLSLTMALFVSGVSTLIHMYSIGYMEHDAEFPKFFVYLNLFVASMLFLVLADNFLLTFLGWEGVGVCSYFLIAFWYQRDTAASAGKKAMIFNRIGDVGFLLAMFLIFQSTGSLQYGAVFSHLGTVSTTTWTAIGLLLFLGAAGKSAQIPLYPWLADAMEGPTPVSALIHAATMVTAGVYLMCRINPILHVAPDAALTVAWVGVATAFLGGTIACAQNDIKKVLAYSTISQLGYMFLAAGVGAYVAAIFLMLAHAFYKALLFLGAGSVIHGMHDEQDIKKMGALRALMPVTGITFLIAWLAIGGVPPLAGFWAKGDVLINAYAKSPALWAVGAVTAILTAYYMGREYFLVFQGDRRWVAAAEHGVLATPEVEQRLAEVNARAHWVAPVGAGGAGDTFEVSHDDPHAAASHHDTAGTGAAVSGSGDTSTEPGGHGAEPGEDLHPHDPRIEMKLPLLILSVCAVLGGFIDLPFHPHWTFLQTWLNPVVGSSLLDHHWTSTAQVLFAVADAVFAVVGVVVAATLWRATWYRPAAEPVFLQRAWMIDYGYDRLLARTSTRFAEVMSSVVERKIIDGAVNGVGALMRGTSSKLRRVQTGYVRNYALGLFAGAMLVLAFLLVRAQ